MPGFLRQSTASQSRALGPFLDDTDFKTAETALTIANTDIKLVVNGGASANKTSGGGTHRVNGVYGVTFDATDTATVGELEVSVVVAGALPVFDKWTVVEEAVYDALYAAAAPGYVASQVAASVTGAVGSVTAGVTVTTNSDKTGYALTSGERTSVADALLDRDMATGVDSGSPTVRTVRQALRASRNRWAIAAGTLTVYKENDSTTSWTAAATQTAGNPVSEIDPA